MMSEIPQWAKERVCELVNDLERKQPYSRVGAIDLDWTTDYLGLGAAFARYIAEHEEPPVDPLEEEATKFAESWEPAMVTPLQLARFNSLKTMALAALKRGMELAGERA